MKTVVVLSLPRSGSSLLAGILQRLGIEMGINSGLTRGAFINKYGNYENQDFYGLNLNILFSAGSFSLTWTDFPNDERVKKAVKKYESQLTQLIKENEHEYWGWKDVTSIYTLPYFENLLTNPHYIVLKRDVNSIVKSHLKAAKFSGWLTVIMYFSKYFTLEELATIGWRILKKFLSKGKIFHNALRYRIVIKEGYRRIDEFVKDKKHLCIEFGELTKFPHLVIDRIVKFLKINPPTQRIKKAQNFIDRDEIHYQKKQNIEQIKKPKFIVKSHV